MGDVQPLLQVNGLTKAFRKGDGLLRPQSFKAVDHVSFSVRKGEAFGIVGESGCGKSTLAKLIMGLEKPTAGEIRINGVRVDCMTEKQRRPIRTGCQMVFQDSGSSLNPRKQVSEILGAPMRYHRILPDDQINGRIRELLNLTGLPSDAASRYPHEFSGGQRQRICIAKALALNPELLILDEPVSALDVSVQAQILNLLRDLQEQLHLTYVFIGHGLGAVHYISDRIAVMYRGSVVEQGPSEALFAEPFHPYTAALIDAAPVADWDLRDRQRIALKGEIGENAPERGCSFLDRCPFAEAECAVAAPVLKPVGAERCSACDRAKTEGGGCL